LIPIVNPIRHHQFQELEHGTISERTAMYLLLVINAPTCILHLNNQFEDIITRLLQIGLGCAKAGLIEGIGSNQKNSMANSLKKV
jgi:hypothetical protein